MEEIKRAELKKALIQQQQERVIEEKEVEVVLIDPESATKRSSRVPLD
jgi:hypothetical protein